MVKKINVAGKRLLSLQKQHQQPYEEEEEEEDELTRSELRAIARCAAEVDGNSEEEEESLASDSEESSEEEQVNNNSNIIMSRSNSSDQRHQQRREAQEYMSSSMNSYFPRPTSTNNKTNNNVSTTNNTTTQTQQQPIRRSNSLTGVQSTYIQRQIEKQKNRGNWNNSIAPPPPPETATMNNDKLQIKTAKGTNNINNVRGVAIEEGLGGGVIFTHLPSPSSSSPQMKTNGSREISIESELNKYNKVLNSSNNGSSSSGSEGEGEGDELDMSIRGSCGSIYSANSQEMKKKYPRSKSTPSSSTSISTNAKSATTTIISSSTSTNNTSTNKKMKRSLSTNSLSTYKPSSSITKRCLSDVSLVGMLKIQPINEGRVLCDDELANMNLEDTVVLKSPRSTTSSGGSQGEGGGESSSVDTTTSIYSDATVDGNSGCSSIVEDVYVQEALDTSIRLQEQHHQQSAAAANSISTSAASSANDNNDQEEKQKGERNNNGGMGMTSRSSFLPTPFLTLSQTTEGGSSPPIMMEEDHELVVAEGGGGNNRLRSSSRNNNNNHRQKSSNDSQASSTFYLQSINSNENITHASSAPDYDYDSISSCSEGEDKGKREGNREDVKGNNKASNNNDKTNVLSQEVRGLLGVPQEKLSNNIKKYGQHMIMSRNTERELHKIIDGDDNNYAMDEDEKKKKQSAPVVDDSSSSDSESIDLAFGQKSQNNEKKEKDKWEDIRVERQRRRSSATTSRRSSVSTEAAASSASESNSPQQQEKRSSISTVAAVSGGNNGNANTKPRKSTGYNNTRQQNYSNQNNEESSDDDDSVSSSKSSYSLVGGMKSRFNQFYSNNFSSWRGGSGGGGGGASSGDDLDSSQRSESSTVNGSQYTEGSDDDDDDDDSSDSDEEEGAAWDKNILTEGEFYVAMSMLVYIYALLRETSLLGHTDIDFDEIDVNSFHSDPGYGSSNKFLSKTKSAGFIIRVVMDELEKKEAFSSVDNADMCVLKEFKQWVHDSRSKQLDAATEQTIKDLRRKVARRRWKKAINAVRLMVRLGHSDSNNFALKLQERQTKGLPSISSRASLVVEESSVPKPKLPYRRKQTLRGLAKSMMWMHDQRSTIMNGLGISEPQSSQESLSKAEKRNSLVGENEIKEIINDALEEPRFFIEGSLLSNLIESGIEVVWFGDRHPNDVVYSICVNRQYKRVSVVFRGTVNSHNWMMNLRLAMAKHPNPITEDYEGRHDTLGLHTGFSLYMTRQRKDDSLTKIEEIFENIDSIGRELAPDGDYELSITGHSLGGALATILSFYAATSNIFSKVKAIRVFTYAAPRVGCQRFLYAYQHLERIGKLRHARFTNSNDLVPLVPFHGISRSYKHVGMHIRLLGVDKFAQYWLRRALDVTYPKYHDWWSQTLRIWQVNVIRNANTPRGYKRNHTLSEYQRRIRFSLKYRTMLAQAQGSMIDKKRSRLKTLDEYYYIKGASDVGVYGELTRIALEDRAKETVRREARKRLAFLLFIVLLQAVLLCGVLRHSVLCENYPTFLHPLLLLTGCREGRRGATCEMSHEVVEVHMSTPLHEVAVTTTLPGDDPIGMHGSLEGIVDGSNQTVTGDNVDQNRLEHAINESTLVNITTGIIDSVKNSVSLILFLKNWVNWSLSWEWKWWGGHYTRKMPPCVWGRCNFILRPHLPWGVGLSHVVLPSAIDSVPFDSPLNNGGEADSSGAGVRRIGQST